MNKSQEKVIIIIPTYNEGQVIADTLKNLLLEIEAITDFDVSILIFDSHSSDDTLKQVNLIQQNTQRVYLASEETKTGLGSAYRQAMDHAINEHEADIVIEFDADGSHQPCYIKPMLEAMKTHDVVIGSRYIKGGSMPKDWGWDRKVLSRLGNAVARFVLTRRYKDFTSGFRATRTLLLKKVLPKQFLSNHYAYKLQLFWLLHRSGAAIKEIPIDFIDRKKGYSKLPTNSIIDALYVVFSLRLIQMKQYIKMCMVGLGGAVIQFIVYNLLRLHYSPVLSVQCAVICAMLSNYIFNSQITFRRQKTTLPRLRLKRFSFYLSYSLLMIIVQSGWMKFALTHISQHRLIENIFVGVGIILGSILNFQFYSRIIWPKNKIADPRSL
jgi:dolichol-phosphate mannosyltransferase